MILIVVAALCVASVPLTGGRLGRLGGIQVRALWTAPAALALQVLIVTLLPGGSHELHAVVHIGTYALLGVFLWANRRLSGVTILALGASMNALAIAANNGVMPASERALRMAGLVPSAGFQNSAPVAHPHLLWLGDLLPVPGPLPNVMSIGDLVIFAGMLVFLHRICGRRSGMLHPVVDERREARLPHAQVL